MKLSSHSPTYIPVSTEAACSLVSAVGSDTLAAPSTALSLVLSPLTHNTERILTMKHILPFIRYCYKFW